MKSASIQFRYAFDENGRIVDIFDLAKENRKSYTCGGCKGELRPVLGEIRKKHFRHKVKTCSVETYLHRIGKTLFYETYQKCIATKKPFFVEYERPVSCDSCKHGPCEVKANLEKFDLTKSFKNIEIEKPDFIFTPDILLYTTTGEKLYVEIAVTHRVTDEKINSGVKIIEIKVDEEEDFKIITSGMISIRNKNVNFFNFSPTPIKKELKHRCPRLIDYFVVFSSGKANLSRTTFYEFEHLKLQNVKFIKPVVTSSSYQFIREVESAFRNGVEVKNCFLCRYHARARLNSFKERSHPIFCKFQKFHTGSNHAAECKYFKPDKNVLQILPEEEKELRESQDENSFIFNEELISDKKNRPSDLEKETTVFKKESFIRPKQIVSPIFSEGESPTNETLENNSAFIEKEKIPEWDNSLSFQEEKTAVCEICGKITNDWWYFDGENKCKCRECYPKKPSPT